MAKKNNAPSSGATKKPAGSTQARRRTVYGLNVAVAIIAATALAIFLNWMVHREYERIPYAVKDWVSYDLTATRRYSLSKQTKQVLMGLKKNYEIVTLFTDQNADLRRVRDMVDNYQRYSDNLTVEHINPDYDIVQRQAFYKQLLKRYRDKLKPLKAAIKQGQQGIDQVARRMPGMVSPLEKALKDPALKKGSLQQFIQNVVSLLTRDQIQLEQTNKQVYAILAKPLPDYGQVKQSIQTLLGQLDHSLLQPAMQRFNAAANASSTPSGVQNDLLVSISVMKQTRQQIHTSLNKLQQVQSARTYDNVRSKLISTQCVVVLGPRQVRLIPVSKMYRRPTAQQVQQNGNHEERFLGEERLTGALVSLTLKHPPMVVFVVQSQQPALGPRGAYQNVAQRLHAANIQVVQWFPNGRPSPYGRPMPAGSPPSPGKGQKAIWVILPAPPNNPMRMTGARGQQAVARLLKKRLAKGDSALVMLSADPMAQYGQPNPLVSTLKTWGITAQLDRIVLRQIQQPGAPAQATTQMQVSSWPSDISIARAVNGLPAVFVESSPLVLKQDKKSKVKDWPLITLTGQKLWTTSDFSSSKAIHNAKFNKATSQASFTIGAAAEKDGVRMIVVTDPIWASDEITRYGALGPGTAAMTGAQFPGNGELFVDSVYWLAGLNKLIAASPQAQDIRRIQPMTVAAMTDYRVGLLAGMPLVVLGLGLGVWTVRRRG